MPQSRVIQTLWAKLLALGTCVLCRSVLYADPLNLDICTFPTFDTKIKRIRDWSTFYCFANDSRETVDRFDDCHHFGSFEIGFRFRAQILLAIIKFMNFWVFALPGISPRFTFKALTFVWRMTSDVITVQYRRYVAKVSLWISVVCAEEGNKPFDCGFIDHVEQLHKVNILYLCMWGQLKYAAACTRYVFVCLRTTTS